MRDVRPRVPDSVSTIPFLDFVGETRGQKLRDHRERHQDRGGETGCEASGRQRDIGRRL